MADLPLVENHWSKAIASFLFPTDSMKHLGLAILGLG